MKTIAIIRDSDIGFDTPHPQNYEERSAARAIVFDADKNIALLHVSKKSYHKLPGGGIEKGEDAVTALLRELREEIGCAVDSIHELGSIEEYRNDFKLHQTSYCYVATVVGPKGNTNFDEGEVADGFIPVWMCLNDAIQTLEDEGEVKHYEAKFIRLRDLTFLKEARQLLPEIV